MFNPESIIRKGGSPGRTRDIALRSLLAGITYLIVIIALMIFGKIIRDGAPALLTPEFPFVDIEFLTAKNETLHVFDDADGTRHQLPASKYSEYTALPGRSSAPRCSPSVPLPWLCSLV
jgi:phosphate transport system permease protein